MKKFFQELKVDLTLTSQLLLRDVKSMGQEKGYDFFSQMLLLNPVSLSLKQQKVT